MPRAPRPKDDSSVRLVILFDAFEQMQEQMPPEQFRQLSGEFRDHILTHYRDELNSDVSEKKLILAARQPMRRIQDFLQGRGNDAPNSEEICDWIHFCYILELYREAAALWQYVNQDDVDPWQYERTRKLAVVCRTRLGV